MPDICRYGLAFAICLAAATICLLLAFTPTIPPAHTPDHMTGLVEITETTPAPYTADTQEVTSHA